MRILSGIQPSASPSGELLWRSAPVRHPAGRKRAFYFIASYHALTALQDPALLRKYTVGWRSTSGPRP